MTMVCSICNHPKKLEIDRALIQGLNFSKIARDYEVSSDALRNHRDNHLSRQLVTAMEKKELTESISLLSRIEDMISKAQKIFDRNFAEKRDNTALKALDSQRQTFELLCKISAYMHESRAMELQAGNRDEEKAEEQKKQLQCLSSDELVIFRSILAKMKSSDPDRRIRIPYSYVGRKERFESEDVYEEEPETIPGEEVPESEYVKDETDSYAVPKMTRSRKPNPLAIKPDKSSPTTKLPRRIDNWIEYSD